MAILLGRRNLTQEESIAAYQKLSDYDVPLDWQIPMQIIDVDILAMRRLIPPVMEKVMDSLLEVNKSTFLHGWTTGITTVTSNGQVTRAIERVRNINSSPLPSRFVACTTAPKY